MIYSARYLLMGRDIDTGGSVTLPVWVGPTDMSTAWLATTLARGGLGIPLPDLLAGDTDHLPPAWLHRDLPAWGREAGPRWALYPYSPT